MLPKALAKAAAKDLPVLGAVSGLGFGIWRFIHGEIGRGIAEIGSGFLGATGIGIGGSLAIDTGILITDIVYALQ